MKKYIYKILFVFLLSLGFSFNQAVTAQCPMCKISLESNLKNGGTAGKGMNKGILMLFAMPYILIGSIGYVWWRNKNNTSEEE